MALREGFSSMPRRKAAPGCRIWGIRREHHSLLRPGSLATLAAEGQWLGLAPFPSSLTWLSRSIHNPAVTRPILRTSLALLSQSRGLPCIKTSYCFSSDLYRV